MPNQSQFNTATKEGDWETKSFCNWGSSCVFIRNSGRKRWLITPLGFLRDDCQIYNTRRGVLRRFSTFPYFFLLTASWSSWSHTRRTLEPWNAVLWVQSVARVCCRTSVDLGRRLKKSGEIYRKNNAIYKYQNNISWGKNTNLAAQP